MAGGRRIPREETRQRALQIAAAVVKGATPRVVAERFGLSVSSVYRCCRESGVSLGLSDTVGRLAAAAGRQSQVSELLKQGLPAATVAAQVGLSPDSVRRIKRQRAVSGRASANARLVRQPKQQPPPNKARKHSYRERAERRAQIAAAVARGLTTEQAAAQFGVSRGLVYYALSESGLELRQGSSASAIERAIVQLATRSNPAETIARRLGVSVPRVRSTCRRHGIRPLSPQDRANAARLQARHRALGAANLARLLDGRHVKVLTALRDTGLSLADIGVRFGLPTPRVFAVWTQALHRLAVPNSRSHEQFVKARRRVLSSGLSLRALSRGRRAKLIRRMRDSDLTMAELARNARTSEYEVWRLWYLALDRAAIVAARATASTPRRPRKRRTSRARRLLRDLVL